MTFQCHHQLSHVLGLLEGRDWLVEAQPMIAYPALVEHAGPNSEMGVGLNNIMRGYGSVLQTCRWIQLGEKTDDP